MRRAARRGPADVAGPPLHLVDADGRRRDLERLPARGFATSRADFAALGRRARAAAAADGGLLPRRPAAARRPDGRRRAGHAGSGTTTPTTASRRPEAGDRSASRAVVAGRGRDRRTRCGRTSTGWAADGRRRSSARTGRGGSPRPGPRRWPRSSHFVEHRLPTFGPLRGRDAERRPVDGALAAVGAAEPRPAGPAGGRRGPPRTRTRRGTRRSPSVEGFVRQIIGWRDYIWHLYWYFGEDYRRRNALEARHAAAGVVRRPRSGRHRGAPACARARPRCASTAGRTTSRG